MYLGTIIDPPGRYRSTADVQLLKKLGDASFWVFTRLESQKFSSSINLKKK